MNVIHCGYDGKSAMTFITAAGSALMTMLDRLSSVTAHTLLVEQQGGGQTSMPMMYRAAVTIAMIATAPPAMIRVCVLTGRPPGPMRSSRSGSPRAPSRNRVPQVGQASSSNDTTASHPVQGQPRGAAEGSAA